MAVCPYKYSDCYTFHTYVLTPDKKYAINLNKRMILLNEEYEKLYQPWIYLMIKGKDLNTIYQTYLDCTDYDLTYLNPLLGMALYQKYRKELNLQLTPKI